MVKVYLENGGELQGRWIAEVPGLPGVLVHADTREEALARMQELAARANSEPAPAPPEMPRRRAEDRRG